jgi:hypothetical protein
VVAVADLLTSWTTGPVGDVLASDWGWLTIPAVCAAVLAVESVAMVDDGERLYAAAASVRSALESAPGRAAVMARSGVATAALLVAVHLPIAPGVTR